MIKTAAIAALLLALPAVASAETVDLGSGRSIIAPDSFAGCTAQPVQTAANGSRSHVFDCTLTIEKKPAKVTLAYSTMTPNDTTPQKFVETVMTKMNRASMIGDPSMGIQRKTLKTAGKAGTFLCWVYDDVPSLSGGAICALEEPSIRFSLFVAGSDAYTAMRAVEQAIALTTLR
ncbi:hypothetical protein [Caulobacter sp. NIBR1757]|uniref:hypothetical protein n=1 Tax=Caulobacter sp. NIBR1757 TaxID=3016000 RepID=UPI0022F00BC8|nr:hypothetical protein [Caulobacter sp. NIBR1757]WGM39743.1 hypothetical protein AMEJIAPC_02670 [Caulobacter sp. NIBR1757]